MKKNNLIFAAALSIAVVASSCKKEEINTPSENNGNGKVSVIVSLGDETKGFSDTEGITWEVGDKIKYADAGGVKFTSAPLTEAQISNNGHTAAFSFDAKLIEADRTGWFVSTKCHPSNYTEVEYTLGVDNGNVLTQDVAGEMNKRYLFLHSGTGLTNVAQGATSITAKMDIAGSIFRVIPYTSTHNDEQVLSVKFESNDKVVGTVGYDRGAGTYKSVTEVNDGGWKAYNFVKVTLDTPFSLSGVTSAETSKGIYFAVAATKADAPLNGYKYTVETDKATYTFDAMDKTLAVGENAVKNVYLNLDSDKVTRVEGKTGYLKYTGALLNPTIPAEGCTDVDVAYLKAMVSTNGVDYTDRLNVENEAFYDKITFTYADHSTGDPVTWVNVKYKKGGDYCHWLLTAEANSETVERSVDVTAHLSDVKGYAIGETNTHTWTFTQKAKGAKKTVTYYLGISDAVTIESSSLTNFNSGYCLLQYDGSIVKDWENENSLYARSIFRCVSEANYLAKNYETEIDWLSCAYPRNGEKISDATWMLTAKENTGVERVAYVVCVLPEDDNFNLPEPRALKVTQKAGYAVTATLSNVYAETVVAEGATINAATLALTVNGTPQGDVAAALSTYGITVTADKGATASVAADGTVTLTVPENKYKNGGVNYTLSVKKTDGTVLASATIKQAEGTEEPTATCQYTYDLEIVNANGFGFPANQTNHQGNYAFIRNIKKDNVTVELTQEIAEEVLAFAYRGVEPTDAEKAAKGQSSKVSSATAVQPYVRWFGGTQIDVALNTGASGQITKIVAYKPDGTEFGSFIVWID